MTATDTSIRQVAGHMLQYAIIGYSARFCGHTEKLTDEDIRKKLRSQGIWVDDYERVERYNRCPECDSWTTAAGKLRTDLNCPSIVEAYIKEINHAV